MSLQAWNSLHQPKRCEPGNPKGKGHHLPTSRRMVTAGGSWVQRQSFCALQEHLLEPQKDTTMLRETHIRAGVHSFRHFYSVSETHLFAKSKVQAVCLSVSLQPGQHGLGMLSALREVCTLAVWQPCCLLPCHMVEVRGTVYSVTMVVSEL